MYLLAKASPLVLLIGGGSSIPYLLNSNYFVSSVNSSATEVYRSTEVSQDGSLQQHAASSTTHSSSETVHLTPHSERPKNCTVEDETKVSQWLPKTIKYVFFSCDNVGREDEVLNANWRIWIPLDLLRGPQDLFKNGHKIDIETETKSLSENRFGSETKFESQSFVNSTIKGQWGTELLEDSWEMVVEPQVYKVKLMDSNSEDKMMYLSQN